jgi:hypothetical protein
MNEAELQQSLNRPGTTEIDPARGGWVTSSSDGETRIHVPPGTPADSPLTLMDGAPVKIDNGQITVTAEIMGVPLGQVQITPTVDPATGRIVAEPVATGAVDEVVKPETLNSSVQDQLQSLNDRLDANNLRVTDLQVEDGKIRITTEAAGSGASDPGAGNARGGGSEI